MTNNQVKTNGQIEYERRAADARANKPNAHGVFNSSALTLAGELCIGMTHSKTNGYYACTYTGIPNERDFSDSRRWTLQGHSMDGLSDLDLSTVQMGIRTI